MNTMTISIENKDYVLDVKAARLSGALREKKMYELVLTENEAATLWFVTGYIGGHPRGARGFMDGIRAKLSNLGGSGAVCERKLGFETGTTATAIQLADDK
jgi:hypothetical protein